MFEWKIIAAPVIGGLIGLITNGIAIRMLFRPFHPVKIGKFTLPFTPGLIPKEQPRIAKAIGKVVGGELLDAKTLQTALASEALHQAMDRKIDEIVERLGHEEQSVRAYLEEKEYRLAPVDQAALALEEHFSGYVTDYLLEQQMGDRILDHAMAEVIQNLNPMVAMVAESAIMKSREAIVERMNEMIREECPELIRGYLDGKYNEWMDKPVRELGVYLWGKKEKLREKVWEAYLTVLEKKADGFLERLDVSAIVEERINGFDMQELERLIMEISRKELHALVWIGGLLGALIGFVNLMF